MEIEYADETIKELFLDLLNVSGSKNLLQKRIGLPIARQAKMKLNHLMAADNFHKYLQYGIGKPHSLTGNFEGYYGVSLSANFRLVIQPVPDDRSPQALKLCDTVKIIGIVDYHGEKNEWLIP